MTDDRTLGEQAERMQRRRTRLVLSSTGLFLIMQAVFWRNLRREDAIGSVTGGGLAALRNVDKVNLVAFLIWMVVLLLVLVTGGGYMHGRAVRRLLADEVTQAHRRSAYAWGYWSLMLGSFGVFVLGLFQPVSLMETVHLLLSIGVVVPLLRFALLERRSERG